jgi:hypothetical protein
MAYNQGNFGRSLMRHFPVRQIVNLKSWLGAAYRHHTNRYGDWSELDYRLMVRMVTGTLILILAAVGALIARDSYLLREQKMAVANAQKLLALGDYSGAMVSASHALNMNGTDLAASRAMADATAMGHLRTELLWAQRLADLQPTVENKLRLAETGLRCQTAPYPVSTGVLTDLAGKCASNPVFNFLAGKLTANMHQLNLAEAYFNAAVQLDPTNLTYSLYQARVQLGDADPAVKQQARKQLETLGMDGTLGAEAYRALVTERLAAVDDAGANHYSGLLVATPQATMADRLKDLEIVHRLNPQAFTVRLQETMDIAAHNAAAVAELSDWMQKAGLAQPNVEWLLKLPIGIRSAPSYNLALARGYLQTGNWKAMLDLINSSNWQDKEYLRLALASHAWAELEVPTVAQSDWGDAEQLAGNHYEAMTNLLGLAKAWQLTDAQTHLSQRLLQLAPE